MEGPTLAQPPGPGQNINLLGVILVLGFTFNLTLNIEEHINGHTASPSKYVAGHHPELRAGRLLLRPDACSQPFSDGSFDTRRSDTDKPSSW